MFVRSYSTQHRSVSNGQNLETWEIKERYRRRGTASHLNHRLIADYIDPNLFASRWSNLDGTRVFSRILNIRVRNQLFQTREATLEVFPETLLGMPLERVKFYNRVTDEYVFDRCCVSFDAILFYYQSRGILAKPANVQRTKFIEELTFFQISTPLDERAKKEQEFKEREQVKLKKPTTKPKQLLWRYVCFKNDPMFRCASYFFYCFVVFLSTVSPTLEHMLLPPSAWLILEIFLATTFTLELLVRVYIASNIQHYLISLMGVLDLVSMVTTIMHVVMHTHSQSPSLIKLSLVFRILKCTRICRGVLDLCHVIWACREYIALFVGAALSCCIVLALHVEHAEEHVDRRTCIPKSMHARYTKVYYFDWLWYSVITVTGVGYGEYYPCSDMGKLCGSLLAVVGVVLFCMAATQLVYNFVFIYYLPDVLICDEKDDKRTLITTIRDEFLQEMEDSGAG